MATQVEPVAQTPILNTNTLIVGFIVAIAAACVLTVAYIVPKWNEKPKAPKVTSIACNSDLDCDTPSTCINKFCTFVDKPPPFPFAEVTMAGGCACFGIVFIGILMARQSKNKNAIVGFSFLLIVGIIVLLVASYYMYKAAHMISCPAQPTKACINGEVNTCGAQTGYEWKCEKEHEACPLQEPTCRGGTTPECNGFYWTCPDPKDKCPAQIPKCADGPNFHSHAQCDRGTRYEWVCEKMCLKEPPMGLQCSKGKVPECNKDAIWTCETPATKVCNDETQKKRLQEQCGDEVVCKEVPNAGGYQWVCPSKLTRDQLISQKSWTRKTFTNYDTKKKVEIIFSDSTYKVPIFPTLNIASGENPALQPGPDFINIINNPAGNLVQTPSGPYFVPYNPKIRLYYQVSDKSKYQMIVSRLPFIKVENVGNIIPKNVGSILGRSVSYNTLEEAQNACETDKIYSTFCTGILATTQGKQETFILRSGPVAPKPYPKGTFTFYIRSGPKIDDSPYSKVLSMDLHYLCENGGLFKQAKPGVSNPEGTMSHGSCECVDGWKGSVCQFSKKTNCSSKGQVKDDGSCTCDSGYAGPSCQYSKATCNNHGTPKEDGSCTCDNGYKGKHCEFSCNIQEGKKLKFVNPQNYRITYEYDKEWVASEDTKQSLSSGWDDEFELKKCTDNTVAISTKPPNQKYLHCQGGWGKGAKKPDWGPDNHCYLTKHDDPCSNNEYTFELVPGNDSNLCTIQKPVVDKYADACVGAVDGHGVNAGLDTCDKDYLKYNLTYVK